MNSIVNKKLVYLMLVGYTGFCLMGMLLSQLHNGAQRVARQAFMRDEKHDMRLRKM